MRITELRSRLSESFPDPDTFAQDMVLAELGGQTVNQALEMGFEAGDIWKALLSHYPELKKL